MPNNANPFVEILQEGKDRTKDFEGFVPDIYVDTVGKKTLGYGFNIDDPSISSLFPPDVLSGKRPIARKEADSVFDTVYQRAEKDARRFVGETFDELNQDQKDTIVDMAYNMGYSRLSGFKKFKEAVVNKDWKRAAEELKNSKWFNQVGRRSKAHYDTFRNSSKDLSLANPFKIEEAQAAEEQEENPFKDIVSADDNPFEGIIQGQVQGQADNPFSSAMALPDLTKDEEDKQKVEANIDLVSRFTGIPREYLTPKFYEPTGKPKEDAKKLGFGILVGISAAYEPIERVFHYPVASLTEKLQKGQPFWKSVWESTASLRKFEMDPGERITFFDVAKQYQQDLNKIHNLPEGYTHPLDKPFEVMGGLALRFLMPDILVGGLKATQAAGKAGVKEAVNTLRLGKEATVESLDRLANYIKEAKDYNTFVKAIRGAYPAEEAKSIIGAARELREIILTTPIGATKAQAATSTVTGIIPGAPGEVSLPAQTVGEIMKTPAKEFGRLMQEVKAAEKAIPRPIRPKTLLSWTIKSGRIKTSALQEILGKKEWTQELPFSAGKKDGRDPVELYEEALGDGLITPMPEGYTGGEGQYYIDQLKSSLGKILETAEQQEASIEQEYKAFLEREKEYGEQSIKGPEIESAPQDLAKKDVGEVIQELEGESGVVYLDTNTDANSFIDGVVKQGGTAQIQRVRDDGVIEVVYLKGNADKLTLTPTEGKVEEFSLLDREIYKPNEVLSGYDYSQQKWVTGEAARQVKIKQRKDTIEILKSVNAEKFIASQPSPQNQYSVSQSLQNEMAELSDLESMGILKSDKVPTDWKSSIQGVGGVSPFAVEPTMPPTSLRPSTLQSEIPPLTALKHGLSPEVQQTIFNNAMDAEAKLEEKEKAGRVLMPGLSKETDIQDPKLRGALLAGRRSMSYLGAALVDWIQSATKAIWEGVKLEFEPTLKDFPQLQDDIRTGPITFARKAREQAELALGGLIGNLNNHQKDLFWNLLGMRDLVARGGEGLTLPRNLKVEDIQTELDRVATSAPKGVQDAVAKYETLMSALGQDLITREKLSPDELKSNYFPHYVLDYLPIWWDDAAAFLPRRLRQPYRQYTKQAVGSTKDISISQEALIWHLTSVFMDNAIDDWAMEQLNKYDLPAEAKQALGKIRPGQVVQVGKEKLRGFQYTPGRQMYPAQITNPSVLNKALEEGMTTEEWLASTGKQGGAPVSQGMALGRYNKIYVLPIPIYDKFIKLKNSSGVPEFIILANQATNLWKRITLDFAGIPFQVNNLFGDFMNFFRTSPGAATETPTALRILANLRHPDRLSQWEQHVLQVSQDKDVLGSGFVQEYAQIGPAATSKHLLQQLERLSSLREGFLRLAMLSYQMKRTEVGLPVVAPEFKANVEGLDKLSSAAYVARNFTVDYLAIPDWYRRWIRGFAAPFITFYHVNAKNWAKYTKNKPEGLLLKFLIPLLGLWAYNNTQERREVEERLPDYWRHRPMRINLKTEDLNGDGKPDRALIWSMQTPVDMAGALIGINKIGDKVTLMRAGKMTPREAAIQQLKDSGLGAPETFHALLNPMIQCMEGYMTNRDPRTRQEVVPSELERASDLVKFPYWTRYFIEKMATPFGQYLKDQRGTAVTNLLLSGPLDIQRALGFYWVNLSSADARVDMNETRKQRGDYDTYMFRVEQRYMEGRDFSDIEKEAAANGIRLNPKNIFDRFSSPRVQIEKVKAQLRQTKEPLERRRLEIELDALMKDRAAEYEKTLPKGAR